MHGPRHALVHSSYGPAFHAGVWETANAAGDRCATPLGTKSGSPCDESLLWVAMLEGGLGTTLAFRLSPVAWKGGCVLFVVSLCWVEALVVALVVVARQRRGLAMWVLGRGPLVHMLAAECLPPVAMTYPGARPRHRMRRWMQSAQSMTEL